MLTLTVYCKDHRRQPVRLSQPTLFRDTQGDIPAGWCCRCGREIFVRGKDRCDWCRKTKGERRV